MLTKLWLASLAFVTSVPSFADCNPNGDEYEQSACDPAFKVEAEMKDAFQKVLKQEADDKKYIRQLLLSQRAWEKYRNTQPAHLRMQLTKERTKALLSLLRNSA